MQQSQLVSTSMGFVPTACVVSAGDRAVLEQWVRSPTMPQEWALRAKILLATAEGEGVRAMARRLEVSPTTICLWRDRYRQEGLAGLRTQARRGRPRRVTGGEEGAAGGESGARPAADYT